MDSDIEKPAVTWAQMRAFFPHRPLAYHLHALPDLGIVYVKNPKAACSTVLLWLDRLHTGDLDFAPGNVHKEHRLPKVREIGRHKVARMVSGEAYTFTFVRDPLRRFQSAYQDKIVGSSGWRAEIQTALGQEPDEDRAVSIDDFVTALERQDPLVMNPHWRPQHINVMASLIRYDHIGRIETFADDLEVIRAAADLPAVPATARNVRSTKRVDLLADRPDLAERVRAIYAKDLEIFGY
ncbi:sulfotransferase family protein [Nocardioides humilatus]|uniref:Sulfotransferase family protein n=1 Tax=Nocardioides humilatus TaxID=2607660 RepID=A0A5B1LD00_9ACTN|nr:sulfotransferase family protein [Nocardioides humilatus]KAA1418525.1 sulfotransferase family protein [Nocardioides humilatus]